MRFFSSQSPTYLKYYLIHLERNCLRFLLTYSGFWSTGKGFPATDKGRGISMKADVIVVTEQVKNLVQLASNSYHGSLAICDHLKVAAGKFKICMSLAFAEKQVRYLSSFMESTLNVSGEIDDYISIFWALFSMYLRSINLIEFFCDFPLQHYCSVCLPILIKIAY